jgi:hypothetical protein
MLIGTNRLIITAGLELACAVLTVGAMQIFVGCTYDVYEKLFRQNTSFHIRDQELLERLVGK